MAAGRPTVGLVGRRAVPQATSHIVDGHHRVRAAIIANMNVHGNEFTAKMVTLYDMHGDFSVELLSYGNPDFGQDPDREMSPKVTIPVSSLKNASLACRLYIEHYELGGGNWAGGKVLRKGKPYAQISYNGRAWKPGKYPQPEISLEDV